MKKQTAIFLAASALALGAQAQDVTAPNVTATGVIRGGTNTTPNNTTLAGDFKGAVGITGKLTTSGDVSIVGGHKLTATGNTEFGAPGNSTTSVINGKSTTINTVDTVINSNKTTTKSIDAAGNVTASGVVTGKTGLSAGNGGFAVSNTGAVQAKGVTADNIATTGGKVNINGTNGNIVTQGVLNAGGKAIIHGDSGNIDTVGTVTTNKLTANSGARIGGGLDMTNSKITRVATGTAADDAVNVGQMNNSIANVKTAAAADATAKANAVQANVNTLTTTVSNNATTAATATAAVQTNLDTEVTDRKAEITRVDGRIDVTAAALATETTTRANQVADLDSRKADKASVAAAITAEENARIAGDVATLNSANSYTDARITNQSGADRAYTDKQVAGERDRAMAAEAAISKEVKQVGAMAMAAAGVAGATPVGDKKTAATVALGSYSGQTAIAVGISTLIKENTRMFGAISKVTGGKTGVTVGASFSF